MKITQSDFTKGIALGPPADSLSPGFMVRARGMHTLSQGSFRTRPGSTRINALNAHSITYFADIYHYGVTTTFRRATVSKKTGLNGNRLSFASMGPTAGLTDWLFIAGGGSLFKIDSSGNVQDWGITAPATDPDAAAGVAGALTGTYQYYFTYYNSTLGTRSDSNTTAASVVLAAEKADLGGVTEIPTSAQTGVDYVEIWRTTSGGSLFFKLTEIANGTATYTDNALDTTLETLELPTDNDTPFAYFSDCLGPHNASMFWITRSQSGQRGRVFYSPIGRPESVKGFIEVTSDDAPLQKLFRFQGQLGVIGESGIFLIGGELPYISREISGCPGTTRPDTVVVVANMGVLYEASDGVRVFDGSASTLLTPGTVERVFRGDSLGGLTPFTGTVADYCRNEYIISDTSQTLAIDLTNKRWRDLGLGLNAIFYNTELDVIAATISSEVLALETEGELTDNGTALSLSLEPASISFDDDQERILQHITFDIDTSSEQITATLLHDDSTTTIGIISEAARTHVTLPIGVTGFKFGIRLTGSISDEAQLHKVIYEFNDITTTVAPYAARFEK